MMINVKCIADSSSDDESSYNGSTGRGGLRSRESSKRDKRNGNGNGIINGQILFISCVQ